MNNNFFPQRPNAHPIIYAYSDTRFPNCLKVGYTARPIQERMKEHYPTITPYISYKVELTESAMRSDGTSFSDHDIHRALNKNHIPYIAGEWYKCSVDEVCAAIIAVKNRTDNQENRTQTFKMRPEQEDAVSRTVEYYNSVYKEDSTRTPKFLWNAKMRFGKTFAAYQLARKMNFQRVLILTFKPAVQTAWREDLMNHIDFEGWQFISRDFSNLQDTIDLQYQRANKKNPIVCFGSFQDFLGVNKVTGGIKANNEWVHDINWDLVIFDEYHFGAWKDNAKNLFEQSEDDYEEDLASYDHGNAYDETWLPITTSYYLYLSGTPFRALNSGEFIEEQIYNWTYSDEQREKENWIGENNPYAALPRMVMMTYKIPDSIQQIAKQGEFDEFDLNLFFKAEGEKENAHFIHKEYVQKWLDLIRGSYLATSVDDLKMGAEKPPMPFSDIRLLNVLNHTLWFMPNVSSCYAMANLIKQKQNVFYHDYTVNICAGTEAGIGAKALEPVRNSMGNPLETKTITLSCGKLTTGVTIKPWTGIFMLRNLQSPETYFQAAFRVQSPWEITDEYGEKEIIKQECYVFDFALDRALKQISDYSCRLNIEENNPEKKVGEFIKFLPVLAYDGSVMREVDAAAILDITMAGTSATLLAKRWESALLVNVDNNTLARLLANEDAMNALTRIEGFRGLNEDIKTIINKSEAVKKAKKDGANLSKKEKQELSEAEKEYKSKRKIIQEKLIKFATRIPVFMYLTDYREYSLKDVITQLEPQLFKKVTGLNVKDFELLVSLNVFNESAMNDAVYKFKRYEDASLSYTGIDRHTDENVGLYSTVLSREDYNKMAGLLDQSMIAEQNKDDIPKNPYFINNSEYDEDILDKSKLQSKNEKNNSAVVSTKISPKPGSTYQPAFVPPKPSSGKRPQMVSVDVSDIGVGSKVMHKAFGVGLVLKIKDGLITVDFNGAEKRFQFPTAFQNGFLKKN